MVCHEVTMRIGQVGKYDAEGRHVGTEQRRLYDAKMSAVADKAGENAMFWAYTPSGSFNVATVKEMPWEPGKSYYIDVTEAPEE